MSVIIANIHHHDHHDRDDQHDHCADMQRRGALAQTDRKQPRLDQGEHHQHNHNHEHDHVNVDDNHDHDSLFILLSLP